MVRIATGVTLLLLVGGAVAFAPPLVFMLLALPLILLASWECYRLLEQRGDRPLKWLGLAGVVAVIWSFSGRPPLLETVLPLVGLTLLSLIFAMVRRPDPATMLGTSMTTMFPVLFVGTTLAYLVRLRSLPDPIGRELLILLFVCVILSDTAAYYGGRTFGRRKLAPRVSPKKTWEGAITGVLASLAGAVGVRWLVYPELSWGHAATLGVLLAVAGIFGDLMESVLKRAADAKDSSGLLPGAG